MITTGQDGDITQIAALAKAPRRFNNALLAVRSEPGRTLAVCAPGMIGRSVKMKKTT